jgi:hypothetical protein
MSTWVMIGAMRRQSEQEDLQVSLQKSCGEFAG